MVLCHKVVKVFDKLFGCNSNMRMADWGVNRVLIIQCCFLLFASAVFLCIFVRVFKTTGCFFDVQKISNHSLVCKFVQERRNRINGTVQDNKSAWWHWRIVRRLHCRDTYLVRILECMKKDSLQHTGNTGLILQNWSSWDCKIFARCQGILRLTVPCTSRGRWYRINGFSPRETQTHSNYDGDGNQLPEIFYQMLSLRCSSLPALQYHPDLQRSCLQSLSNRHLPRRLALGRKVWRTFAHRPMCTQQVPELRRRVSTQTALYCPWIHTRTYEIYICFLEVFNIVPHVRLCQPPRKVFQNIIFKAWFNNAR